MRDNLLICGGAAAAIVGSVVLCVTVTALITQFAWNLLMPSIFGLPELGLGQAWALVFLLGLVGKGANIRKSK